MSPRERAARKLCALENIDPDAASMGRDGKVRRVWEARLPAVDVVLDEIREPSAGMVLAALVNSLNICERDNLTGVYPSAPNAGEVTRAAWVAMIDAIKRGEG